MNEFWFAIVLICLLAGALTFWGVRRYGFAINPLLFFSFFDLGILTLLSAVVANEFNDGQEVGLTAVLYLAIVYIVGFFLVFFPRHLGFPRILFDRLLMVVGKTSGSARYSGLSQLFLIILTLTMFVLLMQVSGASMLWLTNPRMAYLLHRTGSGIFFLMTQWLLLASLLYYFLTRKPRLVGMIIPICVYIFLAYFTGSKASVLSGLVMAGVYYNFFIKRISMMWIIIGLFITLSFFLILLLLNDSYSSFLSSLAYFRDYTEVTGKFLMRFNEFGLQYGSAKLSALWFYVPRALFSDKPFEYGVVLVNKVLFPGMAKAGHTSAMLSWVIDYLDFGVVGVFFSGVFTGIIRRGAYESFLTNRTNVFAFVLMVQLSLFPVFVYASLPLIIVIGAFLGMFCRKRIVLY